MPIKASPRPIFGDFSLWVLILSNLIASGFAIKEGYSLSVLIWVYWFQSLTIGFFNFIRILKLKDFSTDGFTINNHPVQATKRVKIFTAFFFLFHFGISHVVYSAFFLVSVLFGLVSESYGIDMGMNIIGGDIGIGEIKFIFFTALLFFTNHLFSFFYNQSRDTKKQNIGSVMFMPYIRIIPIHVILILGALFGGISLLPIFLLLKIVADGVMHILEHKMRR